MLASRLTAYGRIILPQVTHKLLCRPMQRRVLSVIIGRRGFTEEPTCTPPKSEQRVVWNCASGKLIGWLVLSKLWFVKHVTALSGHIRVLYKNNRNTCKCFKLSVNVSKVLLIDWICFHMMDATVTSNSGRMKCACDHMTCYVCFRLISLHFLRISVWKAKRGSLLFFWQAVKKGV